MTDKTRPGWTTVAFGDVVRKTNDKVDADTSGLERYIGGEHMDSNDLKIRRWGTIGDGYLGPAFHMRFRPGQVLYGSRRTYLRKVAVAEFEGICANTTFVLESADQDLLLPEFLPYLMQTESFHEYSELNSKGSVNPYINFSDLAQYEFQLPSLKEQRLLVDGLRASNTALDRFFDLGIKVQMAYLASLREVFAAAAVPEPPSSTWLAPNGERWEWVTVDEMFSLQLGKMSSKKAREGRHQAEYIKNSNVLWGEFRLHDLPQMSFDATEQFKFKLMPGDLLVCEGGEIGRAAVWTDEIEDVFYQKALHRLRPLKPETNAQFFMHYLRACSSTGILARVATGSTILHLPQEALAQLRLPFPSASEQHRYVKFLDALLETGHEVTTRRDLVAKARAAIFEEMPAR